MEGDTLAFAQVMAVIILSAASLTTLVIAARAAWLRTSPKRPALGTPRDDERMSRLETSVEAIAIEVERISESQRYMVNLMSESAALRRGERAELMAPDRAGRSVTPH